jgi:hypothetical protein
MGEIIKSWSPCPRKIAVDEACINGNDGAVLCLARIDPAFEKVNETHLNKFLEQPAKRLKKV